MLSFYLYAASTVDGDGNGVQQWQLSFKVGRWREKQIVPEVICTPRVGRSEPQSPRGLLDYGERYPLRALADGTAV